MSSRVEKQKQVFGISMVICSLIGVGVYIKTSGIMDNLTSLEAFKQYINDFGAKADIAFFIIQLVSVIFAPIPSNISSAAGGMIFGLWKSFIISTTAIISGSVLVFLLARKLGKPFADRFVSPKISCKYGCLLAEKGDMLLALVFLLPFLLDDVVCIVAGLSNIKFSKFLIILLFTKPWGILAASAIGSIDTFIR